MCQSVTLLPKAQLQSLQVLGNPKPLKLLWNGSDHVVDVLGLRSWILFQLRSIWELPGLCKGVMCVIAVIGVIESELEQIRLFRGKRMPLPLWCLLPSRIIPKAQPSWTIELKQSMLQVQQSSHLEEWILQLMKIFAETHLSRLQAVSSISVLRDHR